ncbi:NUDIX hydrolase [Allokutzneria albata]|uniref:NUDIX domain-containing protein n=1 Tax=Allokutzneria albata TaxID=211114 RepID=A0A1G9YIQ2_ALLAB|nr:NUDIX domain-containing protein [Allokutzneria albata]SDN08371.1 NUDIX domain-containing protein [Allokutzneria albata]
MRGDHESSIRCVGGITFDSPGRLLVIRRSNDPGRGRWSIPGGRVEPGEDDAVAVARELYEETGLVVTVGDLIGSVVRSAERGSYEIYDYSCRAVGGRLRPGDDAAAAAWIDGVIFAALDQAGALTEGLGEALREWDSVPQITKNRPPR